MLELLSQYEDEERGGTKIVSVLSSTYCPVRPVSSLAYQPLSMESGSHTDAVYKVMAARVAEEEQTQRTMIALNEMKPTYPGKQEDELEEVLKKVKSIETLV